MSGPNQTVRWRLIVSLLLLAHGGGAAERPPASWGERARELSLSLEPALVFSESIANDARAIVAGAHSPAARAPAILEYIAATYSDCPAQEEPEGAELLAATAIHGRGCGTGKERLVLAVAMMRAAGLVAYLAASTCRPWTDPYSFGLHDRLLPTWRATGGDYILLEPTTSGAGEFLPPPCPWGQWMPLAPLATRPRSIPTPATPTSVRVFSVVHEDGPPELTQEGLPGGLRSFISAVQSSLDLSPEDGWPQQFVLRERWPAGRGCTNEFRVRQRNPGGHLAATLLRDGNGTTLAIDLRLMAPLATKGASDYLEELLSAVKALRCQLDSVSTTDALRYHGLPCPTAPTAERVLPLTEG